MDGRNIEELKQVFGEPDSVAHKNGRKIEVVRSWVEYGSEWASEKKKVCMDSQQD